MKMAELTENYLKEALSKMEINENQAIFAKDYYYIIRELATSILFIDCVKSVGENAHKETLDYLKNYKEITSLEISTIQDLRIRRNKNAYEGKLIEGPYLKNNIGHFNNIITKLKEIIVSKLEKRA